MVKIQFGIGYKKKEGWINVDIEEKYKPEIQWNMNKFPYPIKSNSADQILCEETLEHLKHPTKVIKEFNRILKEGGKLEIIVPHFSHHSSHLADIHISIFNTDYFYMWEKSTEDKSSNWLSRDLEIYEKGTVQIIFPKGKLKIISQPIEKIINKNRTIQRIYEASILKNIYPASDIKYTTYKKQS